MNLSHHPCFNPGSHRRFGRIHLPVAPRCNVQCKFCNRRFDCVNESRPGVTSALLSPAQALDYLEKVMARRPEIRVVGIAGPGDPFANADATLATFDLVRRRFPDVMLCVATNGLELLPHIEALHRLAVSHVTLTVNTIDPAIGAQVYSWMRVGKHVVRAEKAAALLLERQIAAIRALKARDMIVKINAIILPGINDHHIVAIAERMGQLGVDLFNSMPYHPSPGSALAHLQPPAAAQVAAIRAAAGRHVPQMAHCTRCRADAVGLLGEAPSAELTDLLQRCGHAAEPVAAKPTTSAADRPHVAVATMEGALINQHLGEAAELHIYAQTPEGPALLERRATPEPGTGPLRWRQLAMRLRDCHTLLVAGIGETPRKTLAAAGIEIITCEGLIHDTLERLFAGQPIPPLPIAPRRSCGTSCGGDMMGCG
ncbi:radical SAM protein [Desulfatitalea alkaliphila]|uniref:FeMo cofactor biosynthesis protein NifB n=1 Tax=Desulfatitalea alkaliphila TaxID=2929485 RepID=A0AA41UMV5_9BACT|nr:radical SAM protein [Desulfatitalea alkaliphila]MCJ8498943.1 radical SAM protein [Desulfatitalea alkaliphila]